MIDWLLAAAVQQKRFWSKVDKQGPESNNAPGRCWLFNGKLDKDGYGSFMITSPLLPAKPRQKCVRAHRLSYQLFRDKELSEDVVLLHRCDVRRCVNPDHLKEGDQAANIADMMSKGRAGHRNPPPMRGEDNYGAKLTAAAARLVVKRRAKGQSTRAIADEFGVSVNAVDRIVSGKAWSHATGVRPNERGRLGLRRLVEIKGETRALGEWCDLFEIEPRLVIQRLWAGWPVDKALTTKPRFSVSRVRKPERWNLPSILKPFPMREEQASER